MAQSKTDIFNLALTMLGAQIVSSPNENSKNARALNAVYSIVRRAELRKKPSWNFAITRLKLAASASPPLFNFQYAYDLPGDFLSFVFPDDKDNFNTQDFIIEGNQMFTDFNPPFDFRYNRDITNEGLMDPLFATAFAAKLAETVADSITQSNSKIQIAAERYKQAMSEAAKGNSFDIVAQSMPRDDYETVRL